MNIIRRKISLDDLKTKQEGLSYGVFTATSIYMKVNLTQTIDDMGIVVDLPFKRFGDPCTTIAGGMIVKNISCYDGTGLPLNTGELTAVVYGGEEPYEYDWSNGSNGATISNLGPGIYTVTVTDAEGCQIELTGSIVALPKAEPELIGTFSQDQYYRITSTSGGKANPPNPPSPYITAGQQISINTLTAPYNINTLILCPNQTLTLSLSSEYDSYTWNDGSTGPTLLVTEAGTYSVEVPDECGNISTVQITIEYLKIPELTYTFNKEPKAGSGTENDPYIFCIDQFPVTIGANNLSDYYDSWQWTYGSSTPTITTTLDDIGVIYQYGFTNVGGGGGLSSICCPVGTGNCQPLQHPNIHIMFSNLPQYGCGTASGTPSSG